MSTNDYSTAEKNKLAAITGTNTGDQDLSAYVTTAGLNTKVDKETGKGLSTNDYSTAEKTKLAAITGTNTGDQDLSAYATNTNLALKAPIASPAFTGTVAVGTASPSPAAVLDLTSTSQGLLLPRLTFVQKSAIVSPEAGLILWCTDCGANGELQVYNGTNFVNMVGANAQFALPTLSATSAATAITSSSFTTGGSIESDGGAFVTARGVVWNTSTNPTISFSTKTTDGTGIGNFSSSVTGLTSGVTYYVRAYATNSVGTKYGPEIIVNSAQAVATLATTTAASSITATSASSGGNITYNGGATVTASGVVWSTSASPTVALSTKTSNGAATGIFTSSITGLSPGTLYYVRSYATNAIGTSYGAQISFTTLTSPTLAATTAASSIASTTATSGGDISSDGGSAVTVRGIVWGTTSNPTTALTTKTSDGTGTGAFTSSLTGLTPATTYFVKSYATNAIGTNYGAEISFTTPAVAPTLAATTAASSITGTTATSGGNISSDGGSAITASGIVWGTATNPTTVLTTKTSDGTGTGVFTSSLTGLTPATTYFVKSYATNAIGTNYGAEISFTTPAVAPTLAATTAASSITGTTATSGGNISSDGGSAITASGIVWGTATNPTTVLTTKTSDGTGTGVFTSSLTGLTPATTYFVKSYATNAIGTNYGAEISFTTPAVAPTLAATTAASSITGTTATSGGNITTDGGSAVTAKGIVWGTVTNPTIDLSTKTTDGTGSSVFTSSMTGLTPATLYYVRSYATNAIGTNYGAEISFTTLAVAPTLSTTAASSITKYAATSGGTIASNGGSVITVSGICWSTSAEPTISNSKTTDGTTSGTFSGSITGLTAGTTYYVRAYATNAIGTGYGALESFTTTAASIMSLPTVGSSYGGGKVAYVYQNGDPGYSSSSIPVLIAANADQVGNLTDGTALWSISGGSGLAQQVGLSGNSYQALGAGLSNTNAIITAYGTGNYAAKFARDYTDGTYNDWYLPSIDELGKLYLNRVAIGGFSTQYYWSSTEVQESPTQISGYSWSFNGAGNDKHMDTKAWNMKIRAVRTTTLTPVAISNPVLASTTSATSITSTTAVLGGNVTDEGATQVSSRGLVYGTTTGSSTFNVTVGSGGGTFTSTLTGLAQGTTYFVRSFATNAQGTAYGAETSFTTQTTPTVSATTTPTSITATSALGGGTISSTGGATITTAGLVWGASPNPEITLTTKTTDGTTSGTFTSSITGLTQGTTYHVRAYATNSIGTSYGPDITFTTATTPTVSATAAISSITGTTATGGGTIFSNGGSVITVSGICWSTSPAPTISNSKTTNGTTSGTFSGSITGLTNGTTYYVRAYATNAVGTSYGPEVPFTTASTPTVSSTTSGTITSSTAILGGVLGSTGGATTSFGVIYSTSSTFTSPTPITATINLNASAGTYTTTITGLSATTTYYVKAFATNTVGTTYGPTINFTTPVAPVAVGDLYGGGIVFYILQPSDNGYNENVQHGLIAQPQNEIDGLSSNPPYAGSTWNVIALNSNTITAGAQNDGTLVGRANTAAIIANQGPGTYLFKYVSTLTINGYDDWYVPSIKEINLFRDFVYNTTYCTYNTTTHYYWASKANPSYKWTWGSYISSTQSGSSYYTNYLEGNSVGTRAYNQQQSGSNFVYLAIRSF